MIGASSVTTADRRLHELDPRTRLLRVAGCAIRIVAVTGALIVGYVLLPVHSSALLPSWATVLSTVIVLVGGVFYARWSVLQSEFPVLRAAQGIAFVVAFAAVGFAAAYASVSYFDDAAFTESLDRVGALYLSLATATTVGFGDIAARSDTARIVVMVQMVANVAVVGVAIHLIRDAVRARHDGRPASGGS